jgi:vacuolar protein sorting-associated protein 52
MENTNLGFCVQLDLNLERLRMAVEDLLVKLAKMFTKPMLQTIFLINNYDLTIAILKVGVSLADFK